MSNNPQPFDQPTNGSEAPSGLSPQSRRRFLRAAVITGATAVTVGASAGVVAKAHGAHTGLLSHFGIVLGGSSTNGNCAICFEKKSDFSHVTSCSRNDGASSEYALWLTGHNLAPGYYTMSISPNPTNTSSPFRLLSTNSHSDHAYLFTVGANQGVDCPKCDTNGHVQTNCHTCDPSSPVRHNHSADGLFSSSAYHITGGSNRDLQMLVYLKWDGTALGSSGYTFTGTVKDGSGNAVCQVSLTVKSN